MRGSGPGIGAVRAILIAATVAGAVALLRLTDDGGTVGELITWAIAGGLLVAAGAMVNRAWAALLPVAFAVCWILGVVAVEGTGYDEWGESGVGGALIILTVVAAGAGLLVLAGVAVRRAVRAARRGRSQRSDFSPQNDA